MLQNNPDYTKTVGTVKEVISQTSGMGDVKIYNDSEKSNISNPRVSDQLQKDIYELPNRKLLWQDSPFTNENNENNGGEE